MFAAVIPARRLPRGLPNRFDYRIPETLIGSVKRGSVVRIPWRGKPVTGIVVELREVPEIPESRTKDILSVGPGLCYPEDAVACLEFIASDCLCPEPTVAAGFIPEMPVRAAKLALSELAVIAAAGPALLIPPHSSPDCGRGRRPPEGIAGHPLRVARFAGAFGWQQKVSEMHAALQPVVTAGESALVITPHLEELPLLEVELVAQFPEIKIIVFGGAMSTGEVWRRTVEANSDAQKIILGTRNAALSPTPNLGAIIVFEPESRDLKSFDQQPRFDARDVARFRAAQCDAELVFIGSSLRAEEALACGVSALPETSPCEPTLVDAGAMRGGGLLRILPESSVDAITEALENKKQIFLFHNRRGEYGGIACRDCKTLLRCSNCKATLSSLGNTTICRRCGLSGALPEACANCQGTRLEHFGAGTAALAKELALTFPEARVIRADTDEREGLLGLEDADILIGTQLLLHRIAEMPGKLHLEVIIATSLDDLLFSSDFRASERAWQTVQQLRGAATSCGAELLLQTIKPDNESITRLLLGPKAFMEKELADRATAGYPPHGRLVTLSFSGANEMVTKQQARTTKQSLEKITQGTNIAIFGPLMLREPRQRNAWRAVLALRAATLAELRPTLEKVPETCSIESNPDSLA